MDNKGNESAARSVQEVISRGEHLLKHSFFSVKGGRAVDPVSFKAWCGFARSTIERLLGPDHAYVLTFCGDVKSEFVSHIEAGIAILNAVEDELRAGTVVPGSRQKAQGTEEVTPLPDISPLTSENEVLEKHVRMRWEEAQRCRDFGCYLSSIIMMGSVLEALLIARAEMNKPQALAAKNAPRDQRSAKSVPLDRWKLGHLIDVASELGWLKQDRCKFSHVLRELRNLVHVARAVANRTDVDEATCSTSWEAVKGSVADLLSSV